MNIKVYPFYAKLGEPGKNINNIIELLLAEILCKNLLNVPWQNKNQQGIYAAVYADSLCLFATHINTVLSYIYD